jgi:hypothetical protein
MRRVWLIYFLICGVLANLLTSAASLRGDEKPPLTVAAQRGEVQTRIENGTAIIEVHSGGGIGSATLRWADPKPMNVKQVKVRLRYDKEKPFVALEGFSVRSGKLIFSSHLGSSEVELNSNVQGQPPPKLAKPQMPITKTDAGIEITLPAEAVKDVFTIHWVDYYRG